MHAGRGRLPGNCVVGGKKITTRLEKSKEQTRVYLAEQIQLHEGEQLEIEIAG